MEALIEEMRMVGFLTIPIVAADPVMWELLSVGIAAPVSKDHLYPDDTLYPADTLYPK